MVSFRYAIGLLFHMSVIDMIKMFKDIEILIGFYQINLIFYLFINSVQGTRDIRI